MERTKEQIVANFKFYAEECVKKLDNGNVDPALYWSLCTCMNYLIKLSKEVMQVVGKYKRDEDEELEVARHLVDRLECNNAVTAFGISLDEGKEARFRGRWKERERLARDMLPRGDVLDREYDSDIT